MKELVLSLDSPHVATEPCPMLIFLDVPLSYNQVCFILWELQSANGNISILFPQASKLRYGKENSPIDLHLDANLIWGSQELRGWTSVLMVSGQRSQF